MNFRFTVRETTGAVRVTGVVTDQYGNRALAPAAATIMSSVFLAFVTTSNPTIKMFGVALAAAVLVDAFLVRLVLVPSLMALLGRSNWWLPRWLAKILPTVTLE